jgi:hypothetical protein
MLPPPPTSSRLAAIQRHYDICVRTLVAAPTRPSIDDLESLAEVRELLGRLSQQRLASFGFVLGRAHAADEVESDPVYGWAS